MELVHSSPPAGTITPEGSPLSLSCSSSSPWFFCLWHSPRGDKQCAIQVGQLKKLDGVAPICFDKIMHFKFLQDLKCCIPV